MTPQNEKQMIKAAKKVMLLQRNNYSRSIPV
jgi:hypothetical protein